MRFPRPQSQTALDKRFSEPLLTAFDRSEAASGVALLWRAFDRSLSRTTAPRDPELKRQVANAVAKPTPCDWRLVKVAQIDGAIALAMPSGRATQALPEVKFHGFL